MLEMLVRWVQNKSLKNGLPVPYLRGGPDPDNTNIGYFDLKRNPEKISEIHELDRRPELFELVKAINLPTSIFRTLRCDARPNSLIVKGFSNSESCYVTIVFEILNWNWLEENFRHLYDLFMHFPLQVSPVDTTRLDFIPVPVEFIDHNCGGWGLDIYINGVGQSKEEARGAWCLGVNAIKEFLCHQSTENLHHLQNLKNGETTVS